ncbi:cyclic nucleotide-binding domain-containing protein [Sphingobacterium faecium]|uniref:cyclic nucleotide-binding domain-containing protein n=1 Tax=Sphingobacterium faecium TaxID=34087 RepID=UPI003D9C8A4D
MLFDGRNDKEYIVEFLGKGEIVGEIELLRKMPCLCSIQATRDVEHKPFRFTRDHTKKTGLFLLIYPFPYGWRQLVLIRETLFDGEKSSKSQ